MKEQSPPPASLPTSFLPVSRGERRPPGPLSGWWSSSPPHPPPPRLPASPRLNCCEFFPFRQTSEGLRVRGNLSQTKRRLPPHDCLLRILAGERALLQLIFFANSAQRGKTFGPQTALVSLSWCNSMKPTPVFTMLYLFSPVFP